MSKHTPGPWQHEPKWEGGWIAGPNGERVCDYAGCGSHEAEWANPADFALALAAPDLLEALQYIATFTAYVDCENCNDMGIAARRAIAKATGEGQ